MTDEFVYLRTGEKCRVLGKDGDWIFASVQIVHEYFYGDEARVAEEDGPILMLALDSFYDHPPTRVLSEKVKKLQSQVIDLRNEVKTWEIAARNAEQDSEKKLEKYARLSGALAKLDRFLCGGITHYFVTEYGSPKILTVEETIDSKYDCYAPGRLLTLSPRRGKTLAWSLNQYSDGSGSGCYCAPCTSYEEALALGQEWIDEQDAKGVYSVVVIDFARKYQLTLPEGYVSTLIEQERKGLQRDEAAADKKRAVKRDEKEAHWEMLQRV